MGLISRKMLQQSRVLSDIMCLYKESWEMSRNKAKENKMKQNSLDFPLECTAGSELV